MTSECVRWSGYHRKSDGRPITYDGPRQQYVYRLLWEEEHGPVPDGMVLHHTCENAWCVNITHLEPQSRGEHAIEHGNAAGDWGQAQKTHCPAGHEYSTENTYTHRRKDGRVERHCKICRCAAKKRYRDRLAAETEKS